MIEKTFINQVDSNQKHIKSKRTQLLECYIIIQMMSINDVMNVNYN